MINKVPPSKPLRIFLIRHGESISNVDKKIHLSIPDHAIGLSEKGHVQADNAGAALATYLQENVVDRVSLQSFRARIWVSPYKRTRETADGIEKHLKTVHGIYGNHITRHEHINLVEQQFGLFDGLNDDELKEAYPKEHAHYDKCEKFEGKFWARMPLGESRYDVAVRVHQAFGTFYRDYERYGINNLIIVSHGVTLRAFVMQWLHKPFEWFEEEKNPNNCSIRLINGNQDAGYIYKGNDTKGARDK